MIRLRSYLPCVPEIHSEASVPILIDIPIVDIAMHPSNLMDEIECYQFFFFQNVNKHKTDLSQLT